MNMISYRIPFTGIRVYRSYNPANVYPAAYKATCVIAVLALLGLVGGLIGWATGGMSPDQPAPVVPTVTVVTDDQPVGVQTCLLSGHDVTSTGTPGVLRVTRARLAYCQANPFSD